MVSSTAESILIEGRDPGELRSPVEVYLENLYREFLDERSGAVADYIPELAKVDPDSFAICLATTDGSVYEVGDSSCLFTIQSISKPFTYGMALEDWGREAVLEKIGVEPSGDAFNSISLDPKTGRPLNPMINAGAIAAASLVAGHSPEDRLHRVLGIYSFFAGRQLSLDQSVYESERDTGHRNRAIGHMLRNFGILDGDPEPDLNLYFQQCSVQVNCRDLSLMAATLANGGINPITGERAIREDLVGSVLSVMTTCGMYDFAGEWVYAVGMPAKSGVGGGIIAVLPGQLGIGVFSPRLDARGNSVRGVEVCKRLSADFHLHFLNVARSSRATLRARYSVSDVSSKRLRSEGERVALEELGGLARVFELQGDLGFPSVEAVTQRLVGRSARFEYAVLDLRRVSRIEKAASRILIELRSDFAAAGKTVVFSGLQHHPALLRQLEADKQGGERVAFAELDSALEWCEDQLLSRAAAVAEEQALPLAAHDLCRNLAPAQVSLLEGLLERRRYHAGEYIVRKGELADALYLLVAGKVSVVVDLPSGQLKRLSTVSPGMSFGELAALDRQQRTADVRADMPTECYVLAAGAFEELATSAPDLHIALLRNLMRNLARMVSRLDREIAALVE